MNTIGERLSELRKFLGFKSQQAFAEHLGVKRSTLASYENSTYPPSAEFLTLLRDKEKANLNWILAGDGEMMLDQKPKISVFENQKEKKIDNVPEALEKIENETLPIQYRQSFLTGVSVYKFERGKGAPIPVAVNVASDEDFAPVPVFNQRASAGPGQETTQLVETERMAPIMLGLFGMHRPKHCGIVKVVGDSMIDITLFNGDWCLFDMDDCRGDGIFVISMWGETRVKRLQYRISDRKIVIASENTKRYPDPEMISFDMLESGELLIHGRVFAWFHKHPY